MKKFISMILAICMLAAISTVAVSAQKIVVNVVSQTGTVNSKSTVYAGEVIVDGESAIRYLYSDDVSSHGGSDLGTLMDALNNSGLEGFGGMLFNYFSDEETGLALCSVDSYAEDMDENWKDAVNVAALYYPDREVSDSISVDLFGYDDGYTKYCTTVYDDTDLVDEADEPYAISGVLSRLGSSATDNVTYTVIDGELVKLIDREWDYSLEEITVIYTRAEISGSAGYILGDADGDGEISILDATVIQRKLVNLAVASFDEKAADVDGKGLDITDATYIQRYLAEMDIPYPVGEYISKHDEYELPFIPN